MKYPSEQFDKLKRVLGYLSPLMDLRSAHPCHIHFVAYQQLSEGQTHNWLYIRDNEVKKAHSIENINQWQKVVPETFDFELYPTGCNDNHVETAVKKALKELGL